MMVWDIFVIAVVFGAAISAALYFIFLWPRSEPPDDEGGSDDTNGGAPGD
jgi:hypothetical protein